MNKHFYHGCIYLLALFSLPIGLRTMAALAASIQSSPSKESIGVDALPAATAVADQRSVGNRRPHRRPCLPSSQEGNTGCHPHIEPERPTTQTLDAISNAPCRSGLAAETFPCRGLDLLAFLPLGRMGGGQGSDIWGWTDPVTNREYAIMGRNNGTAFVDVTDPTQPVYIGNLPPHTVSSTWRDIKVFSDHAFIVSEAAGHGMQVFNLARLRHGTPPLTFSETAHYSGFGNAHNIIVNKESGYAYAVGSQTCNGGLHMIDVADPTNPIFAGCFGDDGYIHDAQCVIYHGPDPAHQGREICFNANERTLTIVDVTDKQEARRLSRIGYQGAVYAHQGWLTADQHYFLLGDEGDEATYGHNTRTYIWDVRDLDQPQLVGAYTAGTPAIDHNLYIHDGYVYEANYRSGLRVLDLDRIAEGQLEEVAFFDVFPGSDSAVYSGAWSSYPFFDSGTIVMSTIEQGLFVLEMSPPPFTLYLPITAN